MAELQASYQDHESPMEQEPDDSTAYPCKGCAEVLFPIPILSLPSRTPDFIDASFRSLRRERRLNSVSLHGATTRGLKTDLPLAGHRWHIDCFRCNTCGTLLDSDANLLLLGDGSLICNNCTYSCSACGNKIEDLAILTGDQAYCAGCFRCRNCKRKIENLRYARTTQGMFCMECHDGLMARRRKKTKVAAAASSRTKSTSGQGAMLDKSLPKLPPSEPVPRSAFSPDREHHSDGYSDTTPVELPASSPNHGMLPPSTLIWKDAQTLHLS